MIGLLAALAAQGASGLTIALVAGDVTDGGRMVGYASAVTSPDTNEMGSIDPGTLKGNTIETLATNATSDNWQVAIDGLHSDDDTLWSRLIVTGVFIGGFDTKTYLRSGRSSYSQPGAAYTLWQFASSTDDMIENNAYTLLII